VTAFLFLFLRFLVLAVFLLVLARSLYSWIDPRFGGTVGQFLYQTTEPLLAPVRRVLPQSGMVDFSPLVLTIILGVLLQVLLRA
jgi:YggT family protein